MLLFKELMRVYGALMWSLGKVFGTPEVARVYVGSFWDQAHRYETNQRLFYAEERDLFTDLQSLSRSATLRKVNDLIKRVRTLRAHAQIMGELRRRMPIIMGKSGRKAEILAGLENIFAEMQRDAGLAPGDFPDPKKFREILDPMDLSKLPKLNFRHMELLETLLREDLTELVSELHKFRM